jgi:hypothetical protein
MSTPHLSAPQIQRIQRRLDAWELNHLRALAAELHEQLEQTKAELEQVKRDRDYADQCAEMWQGQCLDMTNALDDESFATHRCVGLTKEGSLAIVLLDQPAEEVPA